MTRKQRQAGSGQSVTYDLNNPRNRAAFEALIDDDDESGEDPQQLAPRGKRGEQQRKREKEKFFKLKDAQLAGQQKQKQQAGPSPADQQQVLCQLMDMFQDSAEPVVIREVLAACSGNFEAAVDALLSMLSAAAPPAGPHATSGMQMFVTTTHAHQLPCHRSAPQMDHLLTMCCLCCFPNCI
jgi:hypothetical protein